MIKHPRIGLGTVQFGLPYGISNGLGRPSLEIVEEILDVAIASGIDLLDTAAAYGDSETVIGGSVRAQGMRVITKTGPVGNVGAPLGEVRGSGLRSLQRLQRESIYGILVHNADDLINGGEAYYSELAALKAERRVEKIGVSAYTPAQLEQVLRRFDIDFVQIPFSVFDQRLCGSGVMSELVRRGIEVHVRSVFLQGLLLMPLEQVPAYFDPVRGLLEEFRSQARAAGVSALQACLAHALQTAGIDYVICGTNSADELREIIAAARLAPSVRMDFAAFAIDDERVLHPQAWPRKS